MTAAVIFGGICDRCLKPFRTARFPNDCLCRACHIGGMTSAVERAVALVSGPVS
ncbi:hypothetical protein BN000_00604 [Mycobacterium europaeum]|uniref:Uncharacterized protein n=1 Tax=Mycobacterium europaeum TaxID=761804 RepID=A0A0U1CWZ8_9MYCO|nr:hypothetical protein [Mycobacterium europaeum]CQD03620.1 hypothetical protein BN000_00604 [Mycobacterium europaeum]